jgi:hypothetical protein
MILGINVKLRKWKEREKVNQELTLKVIENANEAVKRAFYINQWMIIHQGNDYY